GRGDDVSSARVHLRGEALRSARAAYFGLINHVDDQLRRLLNPVDGIERQTGDNTVVLFTADHGEMLGDHYRWRKSLPYEGSARRGGSSFNGAPPSTCPCASKTSCRPCSTSRAWTCPAASMGGACCRLCAASGRRGAIACRLSTRRRTSASPTGGRSSSGSSM